MNNKEIKFWDNGKKATIIKDYGITELSSEDVLTDLFSLEGFFLKRYCLSHYNNYKNCVELFSDVIDNMTKIDSSVLSEIKIEVSEEEITMNEENILNLDSLEEKKKWLKLALEQDAISELDVVKILSTSEFDGFVIIPVFAYIHGSIAISAEPFSDKWDSGLAGFAWSFDLTKEELLNNIKEYNCWLRGDYNEYKISSYEETPEGWKLYDEFWQFAKYDTEIWDLIDFEMNDEVDKPSETLYNDIRNREITKEEVLDYLEEL